MRGSLRVLSRPLRRERCLVLLKISLVIHLARVGADLAPLGHRAAGAVHEAMAAAVRTPAFSRDGVAGGSVVSNCI